MAFPRLNPAGAPPETKVVTQTNYAAVTGVITWVLLTVFHVTLPAALTGFLPAAVATVCGALAGWSAKHTPRLDEVAAQVVRETRAALAAGQAAAQQPPAPAPVSPIPAPVFPVPAGQAAVPVQPAAAVPPVQ